MARSLSACVRLPQIRAAMSARREQAGRQAHPDATSPDAAPLVLVRDARKIFHNGTRTVAALDGVSIEVGSWRRFPGP